MTSIELNMIQTAGIGALALMVGMVLTRKVSFLQRFCIPSPVSGGIIFSLITLALYGWGHVEVSFDGTLRDIFMLAFFTSVGFQTDFKVLKQGGKALGIMLGLLVLIITLQNLMSWGITKLMDVNPLLGIAAGSVSMTGGHGTAGGFAAVLEHMGLQGASTIGMAAATFGLIAGSMIGGPLAEFIIHKKLTHEQTGHGRRHVGELGARPNGRHVPLLFRCLDISRYHAQHHPIHSLQGRRQVGERGQTV